MIKVFFGGSRNVRNLNNELKARTDKIIAMGYYVLIGDANGADKALQEYLHNRKYGRVTVYCMEDNCRNNIGDWETVVVNSEREKKDFAYFSIKDLRMSEDADYGFMVWDGKSKGTLNNILNLCERNKRTLVYFLPEKRFYTISKFGNIAELLEKCEKDIVRRFDNSIRITARIHARQQELDFNGQEFPL